MFQHCNVEVGSLSIRSKHLQLICAAGCSLSRCPLANIVTANHLLAGGATPPYRTYIYIERKWRFLYCSLDIA